MIMCVAAATLSAHTHTHTCPAAPRFRMRAHTERACRALACRDVGAWKGVRSAEEQRRTGGTGPEVASGIPESYVPLVPVEEWLATVERDFDRVWRPKGDLDLE